MSYFRSIKLSKRLLIRAVGIAMLLAMTYRLQRLTEEKTSDDDVLNREVCSCQVSTPPLMLSSRTIAAASR